MVSADSINSTSIWRTQRESSSLLSFTEVSAQKANKSLKVCKRSITLRMNVTIYSWSSLFTNWRIDSVSTSRRIPLRISMSKRLDQVRRIEMILLPSKPSSWVRKLFKNWQLMLMRSSSSPSNSESRTQRTSIHSTFWMVKSDHPFSLTSSWQTSGAVRRAKWRSMSKIDILWCVAKSIWDTRSKNMDNARASSSPRSIRTRPTVPSSRCYSQKMA